MATLMDQIAAAFRYTAQLEAHIRQQNVTDRTEAASDRHGAGPLHRFYLGTDARIEYGRVVDSFAGLHCYKVQPDGGRYALMCGMTTAGAAGPIGARPLAQLPPGSRVWFVRHPSAFVGMILGAEPAPGADPRFLLPDFVSMASRCGLKVDAPHNYALRMRRSGDLVHMGAGRPLDSLPGEWGAMAETGVGVFADSFMAFVRANEDTGLWAFYEDDLVRLAGHNLQIRTAGTETDHADDEGEYLAYTGMTPYPAWEALGAYSPATPRTREFSARESQIDQPHYAAAEPLYDDQRAFHRLQEWRGYAADLYSRFVVAPPGPDGVHRLSGGDLPTGLFAEHVGTDGRWGVTTARGLSLRLTPQIAVPRRVKDAADATGDSPATYRAAGVFGAGPPHPPGADPAAPDAPAVRVAAGGDQRAVDRWAASRLFGAHTADFVVPAPADLPAVPPPPFADLADQTYLAAPPVRRVWLSNLAGTTDLPLCHAYIDILADGNIAIGGGRGEELRTVNGSWELSCPGDVVVRPGRSFVVKAGRDAVVQGRGDVDVSATDGSVRLKAEQNVQVLAAAGGVLIESKAETSVQNYEQVGSAVVAAGVVLKSATDVGVLAADAYVRAAGALAFDAETVTVAADRVDRHLTSEAADFFGPAGSPTTVNRWAATAAVVGGNLGVDGALAVRGAAVIRDAVQCTDGPVMAPGGGELGGLDGDALTAARQVVAELVEEFVADSVAAGVDRYADAFTAGWYADHRVGNPTEAARIGFSFRTTAQCRTTDFFLWESRWQQLARATNTVAAVWVETPVRAGSTVTYPFPGEIAATGGFRTVDPTFWDPATGRDQPPDAAVWTDPALAEPVTTPLDGFYPVTP